LSKSTENGFGAASRAVLVDGRASKLPQSDFYGRARRVLSQCFSLSVTRGFRRCRLRRSSLLGITLLSEDKCQEPFSDSPAVLTECGSKLGEDGVQLASPSGCESLLAEFVDSIVEPPRRHPAPQVIESPILPTDRRNVRYRTHCTFEGKLGRA
jgi:hypothetical protein